MKKIVGILVVSICFVLLFAGCGNWKTRKLEKAVKKDMRTDDIKCASLKLIKSEKNKYVGSCQTEPGSGCYRRGKCVREYDISVITEGGDFKWEATPVERDYRGNRTQ